MTDKSQRCRGFGGLGSSSMNTLPPDKKGPSDQSSSDRKVSEAGSETAMSPLATRLMLIGWVFVVAAAYFPRRDPELWQTALREAGLAISVMSPAFLNASPNLLLTLVIIAAAAGYGVILLRPLRSIAANRLDSVLLSLIFGLAALAYLVLAMGSLGLLNAPALWALVAVGLVAMATHVSSLWKSRWWKCRFPRPAFAWLISLPCLLLIAVQIAFNFIGLAVPEVQTDAWHYHLGAPKYYLAAGRIIALDGGDVPSIYRANFPFAQEMLYTLGLGIGDLTTGKAIHFGVGLLVILVVFQLGRALHSPLAGLVAATIFYLTPIVGWESVTAYNDLAVTLFVVMAALASVRWLETDDRRWLLLVGLAIGIGISTKATATFTVFALVGPMLVVWWRRSRPWRGIALDLGLAAIGTSLPVLPWLVKNAVFTGNALYPLGERFLFPILGPTTGSVMEIVVNNYGVGRSALDFLFLPWNVTFRGDAFQGAIGPLFLALVTAVALVRRSGKVTWLLAIFAVWLALWSLGSQQIRFLIPALALAAPLAGVMVATAIQAPRILERFAGGVVVLQVLCILVLNLPNFGDVWQAGHWILRYEVPWRVLNGTMTPHQYIEANVVGYSAVDFINSELPANAKIYVLEGGLPDLYVERLAIAFEDPVGEGVALRDVFKRADGIEELRRHGFTHLFTHGPRSRLIDESPWFDNLRLVFDDGPRQIYAVEHDPIVGEWRGIMGQDGLSTSPLELRRPLGPPLREALSRTLPQPQ